jgi:magnesium transporter
LLHQPEDAAQLSGLLRHADGTAGRMMTARVVVVTDSDTAQFATESVRRQAALVPTLTEIFVVDSHRRLVGILPIATLLLAPGGTQVRDLMHDVAVRVGPEEPQRIAAQVIARYDLSAVPVVDTRGQLLGRITADDVRHVALDEAAGGLLRFGGVSTLEQHDPRWTAAVRSRLPSLYLNLLSAFGAAAVVYLFEGTLARIIALAIWMPVVAGVGGNAGTQALAASIRRLASGQARQRSARSDVLREALLGLVNGVAIGAVVGTVAVLLGASWKFGFVVLAALVANLVSASVVGASLPVVLHRLGRDPSHASPVIVTAVTDACAFALLLGLASLLLR